MTAAPTRSGEGRQLRIGSLFAGIGGFDLAARWMGWETAWFSEIDPYASAVLAKHWPGVPNHGDITKINFAAVEPVDMLCGGFPCQDISNAGLREGITGKRSGLWSEYERAIRELRPRYVVVENVAALLARGMGRVLGDLSEIGYDAEWSVLSAADVGAPHLRERIWIVAYAVSDPGRVQQVSIARSSEAPAASNGSEALADANVGGRQARIGQLPSGQSDTARRSEDVADAISLRELQPQGRISNERGRTGDGSEDVEHAASERRSEGRTEPEVWSRWDAPARAGWWDVEPPVGRVVNGLPRRVDRLRCLGNAIVPACAFEIFRAIQTADDRLTETWSPCPECQLPAPAGALCTGCAAEV